MFPDGLSFLNPDRRRVTDRPRQARSRFFPQHPRDDVFNNLGNFADLMRNAGKIRESMEQATEALGHLQVEGTAGGGSVGAKVNGKMELLSIRIDPKLLADGDAELLEDLVAAAVNQALTKARESAGESMSKLASGFPLPPGLANMFGPGAGGA